MSRERDTTDLVCAWLATAADELNDPDYGLDQIIDQLPTTPQRRRWWSDRWSTRGRRAVHGDDVHGSRGDRRSGRMFGFAALLVAGAIGATALVAGISQQESGPPPIVVAQDGSGDVRTIGEGVALAQDGDTVLVRPGTYTESVMIEKDITLRGDGDRAAIIIEGTAGTATARGPHSLVLLDSDATLTGLTIAGMAGEVRISGGAPTLEDLAFQGTGVPYGSVDPCTDERGCGTTIVIDAGSRATVRDNLLVGGGEVMVGGDSDPLIEGNELRDGPHLYLADPGDAAIVRDNTISGTYDRAIGVFAPTTMLIEGNRIADAAGDGITVGWQQSPGLYPVVRGNTIEGGRTGINAQSGTNPVIEGNRLLGVKNAILLFGSDAVVRANEIRGSELVAITSARGGSPTIVDNVLEDNGTAISILDGDPTITGNSLCGNALDYRLGLEPTSLPEGNSVCERSLSPSPAP